MKKEFMALVGGAILASITGCATKSGAAVDTAAYISDAKIIVSPYDWGPAVDKIVLSMSSEISAAAVERLENPSVTTNGAAREVSSISLATEDGETIRGKKNAKSRFVLVSLKTTFANSGSPFVYDFQKTFQNDWVKSYPVSVRFADGTGFEADRIDSRICKATAVFSAQKEISGTYENPMTKAMDPITLRYKAYEPESLKNDGKKNPLMIWLHGQGEGGKDVDVAILGNKVSALAAPKIQSYFSTEGGASGAYVLVPQCETYWMDGGDGTNSAGDLVSRYTKALYDLISAYVAQNGDIDENRIYLGGCSNGGYMTMNMLVEYPDYFAAAYPNCEAYAFNRFARDENGEYISESSANAMGGENKIKAADERFMTDEKIERIKHIPLWFVHSADDTVVNPAQFSLPTYRALLDAGAANVHFSYFENVMSADDPGVQFMGHWVWVYLFNDAVRGVQGSDFVPTNAGGGEDYESIFAWLNAQKKK